MKKNIVLFLIFGFISGYLSLHFFGISEKYKEYATILEYAPGWIFGTIISILLYFLFRKNILLHFMYIAVSTVAFYIAMQSFYLFSSYDSVYLHLFLAGLVGSLILILGLRLMYPIHTKYMIIVIVFGALAALPNPELGIFPIWQMAVATAIGYIMNETIN